MRSILAVIFALSAGSPALAFFNYQAPQPPVGGDCGAIAAQIGPEATWYGEFAGNRYDEYSEHYFPFSARGCFTSEYECRVWQNDGVSYLGRGGIVYMRCRQGLRRGY